MIQRFFITEYPKGAGETGYRTGSETGYPNANHAITVAERLAVSTGFLHGVDEYDVDEEGERYHRETVGYFGGDPDQGEYYPPKETT